MNRFCVNCGKETNELVNSLCTNCFLEKKSVLAIPKDLVIEKDKRSGKIKFARDWVENSDDAVGLIVNALVSKQAKHEGIELKSLDISLPVKGDKENMADLKVQVVVEGTSVGLEKKLRLIFRSTLSDASMKLASYYHEAFIQIRFTEKASDELKQEKLREVLELMKLESRRNELGEAIDVKKVRGGIDVVVGSAKAARHVADAISRKYGAELTYSNRLIGLDTRGKEKFRHTYCVRFKNT